MLKTVTFYQTSTELKEKALCQLIAKIYNSGFRVVIRCEDQQFLDELNKILWSYSQKEFIPHGGQNDALPERQPIYLTTDSEVPNAATVAMHIGSLELPIDNFERAIFIFDSNNASELAFARAQYKYFKTQSVALEFWQQNAKGVWEKVQ